MVQEQVNRRLKVEFGSSRVRPGLHAIKAGAQLTFDKLARCSLAGNRPDVDFSAKFEEIRDLPAGNIHCRSHLIATGRGSAFVS